MDFEKLSDRLKGFLQAAQTIAVRDGNPQITPEHFLKALLDDPEGLAAGLITCFAVTATDYPATTAFGLAAFGFIALAIRPLVRINAVTVFGEIYLIIGLILWLPLGFSHNPATLETWNPLVMLAIFALAQQWHQRFAGTEEEPAPFISTICQLIFPKFISKIHKFNFISP